MSSETNSVKIIVLNISNGNEFQKLGFLHHLLKYLLLSWFKITTKTALLMMYDCLSTE